MQIYDYIMKILFPPKCICCGSVMPFLSEPPFICEKCFLSELPVQTCKKCGKPYDIGYGETDHCRYCTERFPFEYLISPYRYEDNAKKAVHNLKFHNRPYVSKSVAYYIASRLAAYTSHFPDICIPAPISKKRLNRRGYNQSGLIAREVALLLDIEYAEYLKKTDETAPQASLGAAKRAENLKDTIECITPLDSKSVLLIDDVYTTGATISECCRALKKSGAGKIYAATFAITGSEQKKSGDK